MRSKLFDVDVPGYQKSKHHAARIPGSVSLLVSKMISIKHLFSSEVRLQQIDGTSTTLAVLASTWLLPLTTRQNAKLATSWLKLYEESQSSNGSSSFFYISRKTSSVKKIVCKQN